MLVNRWGFSIKWRPAQPVQQQPTHQVRCASRGGGRGRRGRQQQAQRSAPQAARLPRGSLLEQPVPPGPCVVQVHVVADLVHDGLHRAAKYSV